MCKSLEAGEFYKWMESLHAILLCVELRGTGGLRRKENGFIDDKVDMVCVVTTM
jgi:hypothetical protein